MNNLIIETKQGELEKICVKLHEIEHSKNYEEFYSFIKTTEVYRGTVYPLLYKKCKSNSSKML